MSENQSDCIIHPTAIVDPSVQLGVGVKIGAYSVVGPGVEIGDRTEIMPHAMVDSYTTMGADNRIFQYASVGAPPQDLKYKGEPTRLLLGSRNMIREFATLSRGTVQGNGVTKIGDQNLFMNYSHVGHDCVIGDRNVFANSVALAGHVTIGNGVILGGISAIHQFVRVGDLAMISGGSMLGKDVAPYCFAQGDRARLRGVNVIGLRRAGLSNDDISAVRQAYRHLFLGYGAVAKKVEQLPPELVQNPAIKRLIDFIADSKRGLATALSNEDEE
jgi:UDP-N-acetylglucosamine acyltransferase